jgi:carboxylesterase type B
MINNKSIIFLLIFVAICAAQDNPIVTTNSGQIRGVRLSSGLLSRYFAFKGIPYAEPPIGNLRFRNPVYTRGWDGVRDGSEHGNVCPASPMIGVGPPQGDEDCLFLNVYTPQIVGSRAVMVYIHGGSFSGGSGDSWIYGPDFFVNDDVILVTVNYRLGVLGFLSTGDGAAQGNYGLKDIVVALRWVRENIAAFGGNPNQVTLFGESAGGAAAHYLTLSRMSRNLFHRMISQSGTALTPWAFHPNPRLQADILAKKLNITYTTTQDLVQQLRQVNPHRFIEVQSGWLDLAIPRGMSAFDFVPCLEPANSPEDVFISDTPENILRRGDIMRIPMIIGYTSVESLFMIRELLIEPNIMNIFMNNPHFFVPSSFNLAPTDPRVNEVMDAFVRLYFNGTYPSPQDRLPWAQFQSDAQFAFQIDRTIQFQARGSNQPIYYYKFSFDGALNMIKRLILLTDYPGAVHADDIFYMFQVSSWPAPILPSNHARTVRSRMVRLWTNFAKTGNPTPILDSLIRTNWVPYNLQNQNFMDIGDELTIQNIPNEQRLTVWHEFQNRFGN